MKFYFLITFISIFAVSCDSAVPVKPDEERIAEVAKVEKGLPYQATNIELVGNNWVTFDYGGSRFLYRKISAGNGTTETITYFPKSSPEKP